MRKFLGQLRDWLADAWRYAEPARMRGIAAALAGLLAAAGLVTSTELPGWADSLIAAYALVWPLIQARLTRRAVTPTAKVDHILSRAFLDGNIGGRTHDRLRAELVTGAQVARQSDRASPRGG